MTDTVLARARQRLQTAQQILADLQLIEQWQRFGKPMIVGAAAYGLMVAPDIDLDIFCDEPFIQDGFAVLAACAHHPRVHKARFANKLADPDQGLYWQLRYQHPDGQEWKIDMWSFGHDHPGAYAAALVEPFTEALTDETRQAILTIKEQALIDATLQCGSIHLYRAVLDDNVRTVEQFRVWLEQNSTDGLTSWQPRRNVIA